MKYTVWTNETTIIPKGGLDKRYFGNVDNRYFGHFDIDKDYTSVSSDTSSDE